MKFSKLYSPSFKEAPKDALLASHILLSRAGYIEQTAGGVYSFLPLGLMVLEKIKQIIREEMNKAGANEVAMSFATKASLWAESGRLGAFGDELLRFKDRKDAAYVLAPTHEEAMIDLVRGRVNSYKDLPLHLYQITPKFRDEARPRFGLLRCKEFIMKDGYSFHADEKGLEDEFVNMMQTYQRIFSRLHLPTKLVKADSGAIGGSGSLEFMVENKDGEDELIICSKCSYAANAEVAKRKKPSCKEERPQSDFMSRFHTPGVKSIKELASFFSIDEFYTVKAVVKKAVYDDETKLVVFFIRGSDELELTKAQNACKANELKDALEGELKDAGLIEGFIGFVGLNGVDFYVDLELDGEKEMIIGANELDYHLVGVSVSSLKRERFADLVRVKKGDLCPECGEVLGINHAIEIAHIFKLGSRYSKPMKASFLDHNGKAKPFEMGCYGIGVSRALAVLAENSHDEKGLIFHPDLAPFWLDIIISNMKDEKAVQYATCLYEKLGKDVLLDDRNKSFGIKINDFELKGFPYALIIGRDFKDGFCELRNRAKNTSTKISLKDVEKELLSLK